MIIFLSQVIVNIDPINMARILFVFYTLTQMSVVSIIYSKDFKSHFIDLTEFVISSCVSIPIECTFFYLSTIVISISYWSNYLLKWSEIYANQKYSMSHTACVFDAYKPILTYRFWFRVKLHLYLEKNAHIKKYQNFNTLLKATWMRIKDAIHFFS